MCQCFILVFSLASQDIVQDHTLNEALHPLKLIAFTFGKRIEFPPWSGYGVLTLGIAPNPASNAWGRAVH